MFREHGSIHVRAAPMRMNVSTLRKEATQVYVYERDPSSIVIGKKIYVNLGVNS